MPRQSLDASAQYSEYNKTFLIYHVPVVFFQTIIFIVRTGEAEFTVWQNGAILVNWNLAVLGRLLLILGRLKIEFVKKFEWQKNFDADRLYFILGDLYKKFSKNYPAVFEQMGGKVKGFQN